MRNLFLLLLQNPLVPAVHRESLVGHIVMVHQSVGLFSKDFQHKLRRSNYVTPKNYLDFINTYLNLLDDKDKYILSLVRIFFVSSHRINGEWSSFCVTSSTTSFPRCSSGIHVHRLGHDDLFFIPLIFWNEVFEWRLAQLSVFLNVIVSPRGCPIKTTRDKMARNDLFLNL